MGYHTTPALIEDNIELLTQIKKAIDSDTALKYDIPPEDNISYIQYKLRRVLAAADNHPEIMHGIFHGLGQLTTIRVEFEQHRLSIEPKKGGKGSKTLYLSVAQKTEDDIYRELEEYAGSMLTISFKPSPEWDLGEFVNTLSTLDWKLHLQTKEESEDGTLSFACEKIEEAAGFDVLDRPERVDTQPL